MHFYIHVLGLIPSATYIEVFHSSLQLFCQPQNLPSDASSLSGYTFLQTPLSKGVLSGKLQQIHKSYPAAINLVSICIQIIIIKYHFQILYFLSEGGIVWPSYSIITWSWNTLLTFKTVLICVWHFRISFYFLVSFLCYFFYPLRPPYSLSYTWTLKSILLKQVKHIFKNT